MGYGTFWERLRHGTMDRQDRVVCVFAGAIFIAALLSLMMLVSCSTYQPPGAGLDQGLCATVVCHPA